MLKRFITGLALASVFFVSGCVLQPLDESKVTTSPGQTGGLESAGKGTVEGYKLRSGDPIYIRFNGIIDQQQLETTIDENGEISLLHLDPINANGLTTSKLENLIERAYIDGGIYKNVSINVTMTALVYYVQGSVNAPGEFPLRSGTTLLQAVASARGYDAFANKKKVTVTRHGKIYRYNMKDLEADPSKDVKIEAGDVIKVWQSRI